MSAIVASGADKAIAKLREEREALKAENCALARRIKRLERENERLHVDIGVLNEKLRAGCAD